MSRKEELLKLCESVDEQLKTIVLPMIDDVVFLEDTLDSLRKLPFIRVSEKNNAMQKPTSASKQYKELLQQYNNCIKILCSVIGRTEGSDDSELRKGLQKLYEKYQ